MKAKGIIMAGGNGTRLSPLTLAMNKHLLPVFDKPMIYYPLSTLMLAGIKEFIIVTQEKWIATFKDLIQPDILGIKVDFHIQNNPTGIGNVFAEIKEYTQFDQYVLILGDNFLYGNNLPKVVIDSINNNVGATVFTYPVNDPTRFGIIHETDGNIHLVEKPKKPQNDHAVLGLYVFKSSVFNNSLGLNKSKRGEYEITELLNVYAEEKTLSVKKLGQGNAWLDLGTFSSLADASSLVRVLQERQGLLLGSPHSISLRKNKDNILLKDYIQQQSSDYFEMVRKVSIEYN
jgi:glucose-1-phosphate thymidylyltransferase